MTIRYGLVLLMALGFGLTGCASGGGGGAGGNEGGSEGGLAAIMARAEGGGERPRETPNTEAAEDALDDAEDADDAAQAETLYRTALQSAEMAIEEDPTNPLAYRLAGMAALGLEDYVQAGAYFDEATELRPIYDVELDELRESTWIALYQEASPYLEAGEYESAVDYFEGANALYAKRPEAMITLGQIHAQLRNHDEAVEALDQAIAFVDSEHMALMEEADSAVAAEWRSQIEELPLLRAQVLADAGRFEEAVGTFRQLVAENPDDLSLKQSLGTVLMEIGEQEEAFQVYDQMLAMPDLPPNTLFAIGVGFYQGSDYDRAVNAFRQAAEANPYDRDSVEMWARSLQLDSAFADVPPVANQWIELDPNSQNAYLILAQAQNQLGNQAETQAAVQAVESLPVAVRDLQLSRFPEGGGAVSGSVVNKTLDPGSTVTMEFTFYDDSGNRIGTVTEEVAVGQVDMAEVVQLEFQSAQQIGGYSYDLSTS